MGPDLTSSVFVAAGCSQPFPAIFGQQEAVFHIGQTTGKPTTLLALPLVVQRLNDSHALVQISTETNQGH